VIVATRVLVCGAALIVAGCGHEVAPTSDFSVPSSIPLPENFEARAEFGEVNLVWDAEDAVFSVIDGWYLYRAFGESLETLGSLRQLNEVPHQEHVWVDSSVEDGILYVYRIRSVTPAGVLSDPVTAMVRMDLTPPEPPGGLRADQVEDCDLNPGDCRGEPVVVVSWEPPPGEEFPIYSLFRLPPFPNFDRVEIRIGTSFADYLVEPLLSYRYWVTAVDQAGNVSAPSEVVVVQVQP
jgi:hypothetical protein